MNKLNKIGSYVEQKEKFIDNVHRIFNRTPDEKERSIRITAFNTLLLYATYATAQELDIELERCFPANDNESQNTINYIREQLRDLNCLCVGALGNTDNTNQQSSRVANGFFRAEPNFNKELSKALVEMVIKTTKEAPEETFQSNVAP
ncbi:hypothetical protein [Legionella gresilensis]|uniref:hypothetical protein n=1 Tax=Legionella gresilensis TaxID=91823 RepID=UPI0010413CDB|nr:hypothetical protein [Legionella gresilensis]